jgi:hypothetical protein
MQRFAIEIAFHCWMRSQHAFKPALNLIYIAGVALKARTDAHCAGVTRLKFSDGIQEQSTHHLGCDVSSGNQTQNFGKVRSDTSPFAVLFATSAASASR